MGFIKELKKSIKAAAAMKRISKEICTELEEEFGLTLTFWYDNYSANFSIRATPYSRLEKREVLSDKYQLIVRLDKAAAGRKDEIVEWLKRKIREETTC